MIGYVVIADAHDPCENLAVEEYLFDYVASNHCFVLYFWQNNRTVVIGRHQNAYTECNLDYAKSKGIKIVRRKSGGGAVYHDLGNLNYTIITPRDFYDINRSTKIILTAMRRLGIAAILNGRNDICLMPVGRKISGNAYTSTSNVGMHHGTILFDTDFSEMEKVLFVESTKLAKRGISSVRSRVANICEFYPSFTVEMIQKEITAEFIKEYNLSSLKSLKINPTEILTYSKIYRSKDWNIGLLRDYDIRLQEQFTWGSVTFCLSMQGDIPNGISIETDALYVDGIADAEEHINEELSHGNTNLLEVVQRNVLYYVKHIKMAEDIIHLLSRNMNKEK